MPEALDAGGVADALEPVEFFFDQDSRRLLDRQLGVTVLPVGNDILESLDLVGLRGRAVVEESRLGRLGVPGLDECLAIRRRDPVKAVALLVLDHLEGRLIRIGLGRFGRLALGLGVEGAGRLALGCHGLQLALDDGVEFFGSRGRPHALAAGFTDADDPGMLVQLGRVDFDVAGRNGFAAEQAEKERGDKHLGRLLPILAHVEGEVLVLHVFAHGRGESVDAHRADVLGQLLAELLKPSAGVAHGTAQSRGFDFAKQGAGSR